jgi:methionine sulfoxide reductase heme-binding subunit
MLGSESRAVKIMVKGWWILGVTAIGSAVMLLIIGAIDGVTEPSIRMAIRATARVSCLLFLMAFVAAPLHRLWANNNSRWLIQNRRFLGLSMAVSHAFHGLTIGGLYIITEGRHPQISPLALLGYVFLIAMAATSFPSTAKAIGSRAWRILHGAGMHYFWLAFLTEFAIHAWSNWVYFLFTLLVVLVMAIRLWPQRGRSILREN